jgi:hypothetical protein
MDVVRIVPNGREPALPVVGCMIQDSWAFGASVLGAMLDMTSGQRPVGAPGSAATERSATRCSAMLATNLASLMTQALLATTASGFRTWQSLAQIHGAHRPLWLSALFPFGFDHTYSGKATRQRADELRAWFREIGEVSVREARCLQVELEDLGEAVAQGIEPLDPLARHRRRWRTKS